MERKGENRSWEDHPLKRRRLLWPWTKGKLSTETARRLEQSWSTLPKPSLALTQGSSAWSLPHSLLTNPQASACSGNRKAAKSFKAEASLGAEFAGSCRDPQLSASEYLTQTHRWPEGSLHTCQGYAARLLGPIWEDFQSSNPLSLGPKKRWEKEEELLLKSSRYPSEVIPLTGLKI